MRWYVWRCWRLAYAPRKRHYREITDSRGRWRRVIGSLFYRSGRP